MNTLMKLLSMLLLMNIFVYIAINFSFAMDESTKLNPDLFLYFKGDLIEKFMASSLTDIAESTRDNWTDYDIQFNESMSKFVTKKGGASFGEGGISFLDTLDIAWAFFATLWNVAFAPMILFFNFRVPIFVGLLLGIPLVILYITTIILAIRGIGD